MFAIIVSFLVLSNGAHGEGVTDDRFSTLQACEQERAARVEGFRIAMDKMHQGIAIIGSHCGLAGELGATKA